MLYAVVLFVVGLIKLHFSDQAELDTHAVRTAPLTQDHEYADLIERFIKGEG